MYLKKSVRKPYKETLIYIYMSENCSRCRNKELTLNDFKKQSNGDRYATCNFCREYDRIRKQNNKEQIKVYARAYYQEVKEEKIKQAIQWRNDNIERLTTKIECPCGGKFQFMNKSAHLRTQKHNKWLESQSKIIL